MSGNEEPPQEGGGGDASKKDDIYENRGTKKIIRLVTVMAYMFSVSFVAIVLSAYYIFLWEPPNPTLLRRPGPFSSDPELDFLRSDPIEDNEPFYHRHHKNHTSFLSARVIKDNLYPRFEFPVPITEPNDVAEDHAEKRKDLNKSLASLKNYLIEVLQHKPIEPLNYTEMGKKTGGKVRRHSSVIMNSLLNNNGSSQTLESPTISGGHANNDRLTIGRRDSVYDSPANVLKQIVSEEKFGDTQALAGFNTEVKTPWYANVPSVEFINTTMRNDEGNVDTTRNKDRTGNIDNANNQSATDSYQMDFPDHLKYSKLLNESRAMLNVARNSKETQIEELTTKSLSVTNSTLSESTTASYRPKDLLTILVQSANVTSSTSPITTFHDLQTNSSTEETSTKILTSDIN